MEKPAGIIQKTYDLIRYLFPILQKLPRDQKFFLGDRIQTMLLDILEMYIKAYYSAKEEKRNILTAVNISLEQFRYLIHLTYDSRYIPVSRYENISVKVNELGKMTGGWIKSMTLDENKRSEV